MDDSYNRWWLFRENVVDVSVSERRLKKDVVQLEIYTSEGSIRKCSVATHDIKPVWIILCPWSCESPSTVEVMICFTKWRGKALFGALRRNSETLVLKSVMTRHK